MGDPAGVGPQLMLDILHTAASSSESDPRFVLFGDSNILEHCANKLGLPSDVLSRASILSLREFLDQDSPKATFTIVNVTNIELTSFVPSQVSAQCGAAGFQFIQAALDAAIKDRIDAVTTGPINKEALNAAEINFPGHTEMFAERAVADKDRPNRWCMMQYSQELTCTFATVHVGYHEVPGLLTESRVWDTIELTREAILPLPRRSNSAEPKIVVCGLNPHAGENGLFGNAEEESSIKPAIERGLKAGFNLEGPLPGDTAFLPWRRAETDAFVCMYHDQGHIPLKALAFDHAVNTTLGLKIIRTSVDHGTAFDIAWGNAPADRQPNSSSLQAAVDLAVQLSANRRSQQSQTS